MSNDYSWVDDLIGGMADDFNPEVKVSADSLDDGDYEFKIQDMELTRIESSGTPIVRWTLKVLGGPSCVESTVERTSYFSKPISLNILGSDLVLLGAMQRDWKKAGIPLPQLLISAVSNCIGKVFKGRKKTSVNQSNGKTYHNISVVSLVKGSDEETPF